MSVSERLSQSDGDSSSISCNSDSDSDSSVYATDDEVEPTTTPANFSQVNSVHVQPVQLEVKHSSKTENAASLPLVSILNARSLYQKKDNFKKIVKELGLEIIMVSETWEREEISLESLLQYKITRCSHTKDLK